MKLRNKKTGEILDDVKYIDTSLSTVELHYLDNGVSRMETFKSFTELTEEWEEWEDCKLAEPLIKDEKVRKAVRAWAEANSICRAIHYKTAVGAELIEINYEQPTDQKAAIEFNKYCGLEESKEYAIAELCGEED